MTDNPKIQIEETTLEDLILLGDNKLIDIEITYPLTNGKKTSAKAKIKQLTMEELKNINLETPDLETYIAILRKSLYTQNEKPFKKELILKMPVGVVTELANTILEVSGVDPDEVKKPLTSKTAI